MSIAGSVGDIFYVPFIKNEEFEAYLLILRSLSSFLVLFIKPSADSVERSIFFDYFMWKVGDFVGFSKFTQW
jgi:hypothetical protein